MAWGNLATCHFGDKVSVTAHWGTRYTPTGKTIWAEQSLPTAYRRRSTAHTGG